MDRMYGVAIRLSAWAGVVVLTAGGGCSKEPLRARGGGDAETFEDQLKSGHEPAIEQVGVLMRRSNGDERAAEREAMVMSQIARRGVMDARVLDAMRRVRRHAFVPADVVQMAYADGPLPIGFEQTISQPYIVAAMTEALAVEKGQRILEIGTGSGYQAAVLSEIAGEIFTIERHCALAERAEAMLKAEGYVDVNVRCGDGYAGWPERAPFERIIVTAAPPTIPEALLAQLAPGGRLVIPVGTETQELRLVTKGLDGHTREEVLLPVRFVPMVRDLP